jgi:hypothetical protein
MNFIHFIYDTLIQDILSFSQEIKAKCLIQSSYKIATFCAIKTEHEQKVKRLDGRSRKQSTEDRIQKTEDRIQRTDAQRRRADSMGNGAERIGQSA